MAENKTKPESTSVDAFIEAVPHAGKRADARVLDALFQRVTGQQPVMWGPTIVGYGSYHYRYDSGHEGDMCRVGFSPRKAKHSLYVACTRDGPEGEEFTALLARLGKYSQGNGGCLYVNKLADVDLGVMEEMVALGWERSLQRYPS
ncbi:MAG TPA: DUF1801 domain-containing protein [Paracoccaceae bacterium]|nr:DUF1801 domain-containing protein [Paracoccaceae bacterium]